jgi:membrane-associated phospholipid phosphatase
VLEISPLRDPHFVVLTAQSGMRQPRGFLPQSWSLVGSAVLVLVVVALAIRVRAMTGPLPVDTWVSHDVVGRVPWDELIVGPTHDWIARVGARLFVGVMMIVTFAWALRHRDGYAALFAVVGPGLAFITAEAVIKPVVARRMPGADQSFVFPSGTVTVVSASAAATVVLVYRWAGVRLAVLSAIALAVVPLLMCLMVVVLHWHYATDAFGGLALGGAVVLALAASCTAVERRHRPTEVAL